MSDNKTPIQICIEKIEERISIYYSERQECVNDDDQKGINSCDSLINELNRTIDTLKSHLALEEKANEMDELLIKSLLRKLLDMIDNNYQHKMATELVSKYFNQKFKPE